MKEDKNEGVWWCTPVIAVCGRLRQEGCKFEPSLGNLGITKTMSQKKGRAGDVAQCKDLGFTPWYHKEGGRSKALCKAQKTGIDVRKADADRELHPELDVLLL